MSPLLLKRLSDGDLTKDVLVSIFSHLESIMSESNTCQSALTLGYVEPNDVLQPGDLIPTINIVLTRYQEPPDDSVPSS
jgi:hypothetical protein